jgi:hypothetical protein
MCVGLKLAAQRTISVQQTSQSADERKSDAEGDSCTSIKPSGAEIDRCQKEVRSKQFPGNELNATYLQVLAGYNILDQSRGYE